MKRTSQLALSAATLLLLQSGTLWSPPAIAQEAPAVMQSAASDQRTITDKRPVIHPNSVKFGAYDPHGDFTNQADVSAEGLFLPWEDVDLESLRTADAYALQRGRKLLISIEPWSWSTDWKLTPQQLRDRTLRGDYDPNMQAIAQMIAQLKSPVVVRWGQEMEDTSGRFSWAGWKPEDYITAYRHAMDIVRKTAPAAKIMWSPKGLPGLNAYYPGNNYVDVIGLSVFGLEAYDKMTYGAPRTFAQALAPGYALVEGYGKPIWVAEMGYEGSDQYIKPWIDTVTAKNPQFPLLTDVVYFNDKDLHPWPNGLGKPDWRVVRETASN